MFLYLAMIDSDTDKSKFEILYSEYKNLMYYTANRILRNSRDAEDVVHQAFLKVIEILDTISSPRCHKTRALLVTITEHKAIDLYREKQRRNVLPLVEEYVGAAPAAEERYRADLLVQTAERLVRENPAGWQGTASELTGWVKETTGVSLNATSLSRQLRNLRDDLLNYDNIVYVAPATASNGQRQHTLYKSVAKCSYTSMDNQLFYI